LVTDGAHRIGDDFAGVFVSVPIRGFFVLLEIIARITELEEAKKYWVSVPIRGFFVLLGIQRGKRYNLIRNTLKFQSPSGDFLFCWGYFVKCPVCFNEPYDVSVPIRGFFVLLGGYQLLHR